MAVTADSIVAATAADATASGQLWIVSDSEEIVKAIESRLRNSGHALRAERLSSLVQLESRLRDNPPDLLLADREVREAPRDRVLSLCRKLVPDLPVLLLGRDWTLEACVAALAAGARDYVACAGLEPLRHLELVVLRELIQHQRVQELRKTQGRLADFESRHRQLTDSTGDAVGIVHEGILSGANLAFLQLLGHQSAEAIIGQPLIDLVDPSQQAQVKDRLRLVLKGRGGDEPLELKLVGRSGTVDVRAQLILGRQDGEQVIELLIHSRSAEAPASATPLALSRDRRAFLQAIARPRDAGVVRAALLLRIDDFRAIEERIGHADAQDIAGQLALSVEKRISAPDEHFAFSTDEVALLLQRPGLEPIERFAETLCHELKDQVFSASDRDTQLTVSIAVYPLSSGDQADKVVRELVIQVRQLSEAGGSRCISIGAVADANAHQREDAQLVDRLRAAIASGRFRLAFQTIASLEGDSRTHYDVLLRMLDDKDQELHASEFLPLATRVNLMTDIDRWVVVSALNMIRQQDPRRPGTTLFVKLSEQTVCEGTEFLAWLREQIGGQALRADDLVFELQEQTLQNQIRKGKALTQALLELGAGVAIEHFGTSTNSAALLTHIQTRYLKFAPSFTHDFSNKDVQKKLSELVELAKQKRIKTIVSHVEDANVMARLWQMGVNFVQGYHVQEPEVVLLSGDSNVH